MTPGCIGALECGTSGGKKTEASRRLESLPNREEYRTERLPGEVSCGRLLCFFILDTYAAFVGKRKKLTKFIKIIDKKTKPVYDETIVLRL